MQKLSNIHVALPNGWTVSLLGKGDGCPNHWIEVWAWDAEGRSPDQPRVVAADKLSALLAEVAAR